MTSLAGRNVLVTGATGFVGGHLMQALVKTGARVSILAREERPSVADECNVIVVRGDLCEDYCLETCDVVIHCAAAVDIDRCVEDPLLALEVNTAGTVRLLEKVKDRAKRFVYVSTLGVYGRSERCPIDESQLPSPMEPYAASKFAAETFVLAYKRAYGLNATVARLFSCYGEGQRSTFFVPRMIRQILAGEAIDIYGPSVVRDFIHVDDAVSALMLVTEKGCDDLYNVGTGQGTSVEDVARLLKTVARSDVPVVLKQGHARRAGIEVPVSVADVAKLTALGWQPRYSLRKGLETTYRYYYALSN